MQQTPYILITGTNKGLGHDLVKVFLKRQPQAKIIATSREAPEVSYKKWEELDVNKQITCATLDILSTQSIQNFVKRFTDANIKFDVLFNNAGISSMTLEALQGTYPTVEASTIDISTNILGVINFTKHVLPLLSDTATVVNVSSTHSALKHYPKHSQERFENPAQTQDDIVAAAHEFLKDVENKKWDNWFPSSYSVSKMLLNAWGRFVLSRQVKAGQRVINMSPGLCVTPMMEQSINTLKMKAITGDEGAEFIYQTAYLQNTDSNKFYHRARETNYITGGSEFPV